LFGAPDVDHAPGGFRQPRRGEELRRRLDGIDEYGDWAPSNRSHDRSLLLRSLDRHVHPTRRIVDPNGDGIDPEFAGKVDDRSLELLQLAYGVRDQPNVQRATQPRGELGAVPGRVASHKHDELVPLTVHHASEVIPL
jgi:hypothetical protein